MKLRENIPESVLNTFSKLTGFATEDIKFIRGFLCPFNTYAITHMNVDMTTSMPENQIENFNKYAMTCLKDLDSMEWSILDGVHMLAKTPNSEKLPISLVYACPDPELERVFDVPENSWYKYWMDGMLKYDKLIKSFTFQVVTKSDEYGYVSAHPIQKRDTSILFELSTFDKMFV